MSKPAKKTTGAAVPKSPKELADWMLQDAKLRQRVTNIVVEADQMIEKEVAAAFSQFLKEYDIDLRTMSHADATEAINRFYRNARLAGRYIRMW